jgi:5'-phosphate synthase pdxT subunit
MQPTVGVLALQGDFREHEAALTSVGARTRRVRTATDLADVSALVIPGGESTAMSLLAESFEVLQPIRQRISEGMPVYGSCAGMIMLAERILDPRAGQKTFGGLDITVRRNAFGRQVDSFEASLHAPDIVGTDELTAVFIRAPWVEEVGPEVQVMARVESGPHAGAIVGVRQGNVLATAFHPELTDDHRIHAYFLNMVENAKA